MPSRRASSMISVTVLAIAWVCGSVALADAPSPAQPQVAAQHQPAAEPDLLRLLLSGSGNTAMLAVLLWSKLTQQDKEMAALKELLQTRPCIGDGECHFHHHRRKGDDD